MNIISAPPSDRGNRWQGTAVRLLPRDDCAETDLSTAVPPTQRDGDDRYHDDEPMLTH
jgi:hypothetical protein